RSGLDVHGSALQMRAQNAGRVQLSFAVSTERALDRVDAIIEAQKIGDVSGGKNQRHVRNAISPAIADAAITTGSGRRFQVRITIRATAAMIEVKTSVMATRAMSHVVATSTPTTALPTPRMNPLTTTRSR